MIDKLIIELSEKGEPKAAKELAIAYLKHEKNVEILNLLGKLHHDDKEFDKALECMNALPESPGVTMNKDRKSTRLNSSHVSESRMPSSA